jgi:predicted aldo/keto reductase-like oxidoreductase
MLYRDYGQTGKKVSLLGFGGMRFGHIDDEDECIRMMIAAAKGGVNYFDTAPGYFETKSESLFGKAFAELRRRQFPYYVATKTFKTTEKDIRLEIEAQLKRLGLDSIDFYHIWCIANLDNWKERKRDGILDAFRKLKAEGLIKHICVSSHLVREEINELLMEGVFEGVLFGYSAYNYRTRESTINAVREKKLGAVVMNPLGGGIIPRRPEHFEFLKQGGDESAVSAALRFLWDHRDISVTLVGFTNENEVSQALAAMEGYTPRTEAELEAVKAASSASLEGVCTGCAYCDDCPQDIPIPKFMDAFNEKLLNDSPERNVVLNRLKNHWHVAVEKAKDCVACGQCESACTQHINIIERLKLIGAM